MHVARELPTSSKGQLGNRWIFCLGPLATILTLQDSLIAKSIGKQWMLLQHVVTQQILMRQWRTTKDEKALAPTAYSSGIKRKKGPILQAEPDQAT